MLAAALCLASLTAAAGEACDPGTPPGTTFKGHAGAGPPAGVRGTFCAGGDGVAGWAGPRFTLGDHFSLYVAGYPNAGTQRLWLRRDGGAQLRLELYEEPGPRWTVYHFQVPEPWRGAGVRLAIGDAGTGPREWVAVATSPSEVARGAFTHGNAAPAVMAAAYLLLLLLPGLAAASAGRATDPLSVWTVTLLVAPGVAYLAFWAAMAHPGLAPAVLVAVWISTVLALASRRARAWGLLRDPGVWRPAALALATVAFYAAAAFLFNGFDDAVKLAGWRYSHKLPGDNYAPLLMARGVAEGQVPPPMPEGWLSSDRTPLQAAFVVLHWPLTRLGVGGTDAHYQSLGMALQTLWIPAMWVLLARWGVSAAGRAAVLLVCLCSSAVIVNTVYVWPKLLSAGYLLLGAAPLLGRAPPPRIAQAAAGGAALAFAYLAHGGAAFGILAIAVLRVVQRPLPGWQSLAAAAAAVVLLYAPWAAYQTLVDPLVDAYARPPSELARNRAENVRALFGSPVNWLAALATLASAEDFTARREALTRVRGGQFFRLAESLLLLLPAGLAALAVDRLRRRPPRRPAARADGEAGRSLLALGVLGTAVWALLLYGPRTTLIHQGSYLLPLALIAGSMLQLWALSRSLGAAFALAWCAVHAYVYWWLPPVLLWTPALPDLLVGTRLSVAPGVFNVALVLAGAAAVLAALAGIAREPFRHRERRAGY